MGGTAGGDNNLGFRVKRRRFVIETVNGDIPAGAENEVKKAVVETPPPKMAKVGLEGEGEVGRATKVRFAGEDDEREKAEKRKVTKSRSVAATIHKQPELYEF